MAVIAGAPGPHVLLAGDGVAAMETVLALRALPGGSSLEISLVGPALVLRYWPLVPGPPGGPATPRNYALASIFEDFGVTARPGLLLGVAGDHRTAILQDGTRLPFDTLVIATGAVPRPPGEAVDTIRGDGTDPPWQPPPRAADGGPQQVVFVEPDVGWSLPLYALVLRAAAAALADGRGDLTFVLATPRATVLSDFAGDGADAVARLLTAAGIELLTGTDLDVTRYDGQALSLRGSAGPSVPAARVLTMPHLRGHAHAGVPCDANGFVSTGPGGHVPGTAQVYAAGDATAGGIKNGSLAAQQADAVAAGIVQARGSAARLGPVRRILRAILDGGSQPLYLRATVEDGRSIASSASRECPWWPPEKIAARHLAPYLADRRQAP